MIAINLPNELLGRMNWIWLLLFFAIMATLNLVLAMRRDKEKLGKLRYLHIILYLISVLAAAFGFYHQQASSQDTKVQNKVLRSEVTQLSERIDYLQGQQQDLIDGNRGLLSKLDIAISNSDTILAFVKADTIRPNFPPKILGSKSQLIELEEKRRIELDPVSKNEFTSYIFRSREATPLRDIRIELKFDKPVLAVESHFLGAFVIDQGTRDTLINLTKYIYQTGYLSQSNDILIRVQSSQRNELKSVKISP